MAIVSGDQLLWYIDVISYAFMRKFPTGAVTYLTYPENRSFSKIFFASHHIWFLPLCLWVRSHLVVGQASSSPCAVGGPMANH